MFKQLLVLVLSLFVSARADTLPLQSRTARPSGGGNDQTYYRPPSGGGYSGGASETTYDGEELRRILVIVGIVIAVLLACTCCGYICKDCENCDCDSSSSSSSTTSASSARAPRTVPSEVDDEESTQPDITINVLSSDASVTGNPLCADGTPEKKKPLGDDPTTRV
jgi:hypothetical protein